MRRLALACALAGCTEDTTPPWQLDHDRVVAVRALPPALAPGEVGRLEALIAHAGSPTSVEPPRGATAALAPGELFTAVHFNIDHWEIVGPGEAQLDVARGELGLPAGAPVPLEVSLQFAGPLYAKKTVWLGEPAENPALPPVAVDGLAPGFEITLAIRADVSLEIDAELTVRWLTSCGSLLDPDAPSARLTLDARCDGELAVVVRDARGGVAWQVWPLHAR